MNATASLSTLLEQAESERDDAQRALQRCLADSDGARRQWQQLLDYRREYEARYVVQMRQPGQSIQTLRNYQDFMQRLSQAIEQQAGTLQQLERRIEPARASLQQRETRVASVRKLIERRVDEQRRADERRQQRASDEAAARIAAARAAQEDLQAQADAQAPTEETACGDAGRRRRPRASELSAFDTRH